MSELNDDDGFVTRSREVGVDRAAYELLNRQENERQRRVDELLLGEVN